MELIAFSIYKKIVENIIREEGRKLFNNLLHKLPKKELLICKNHVANY